MEGRKWLTANQGRSIDYEARGALYANLSGKTGLLLDYLGVLSSIQAIIEGFRVQSRLDSEFLEIVFAESAFILAVLAGEQKIMVFPKFILVRGALGCLS